MISPYKLAIVQMLLLVSTIGHSQTFEPKKGNLSVLNNLFHTDYNILVTETITRFGDSIHPVMVFTGDTLILMYQNKRQTSRVIPSEYHQLKAFSHLPLAIFTMVSTWKEGPVSDSNLVHVHQYEVLIDSIEKELATYHYASILENNQRTILSHSRTYIHQLLNTKTYKEKDRNVFAQSVRPFIVKDVDESARLEIMALHEQVQKWLIHMDTISRQQLYVVIGSSHQARYREVSVQYFDKILNESSSTTALKENKLVFAESVFDEKGCLSMLARHIIDQKIGLDFFGDRYRMQRDLMSDAATKYINQLFPTETKKKKAK